MTSSGNTVIITTHYIEEAKRASNVGFMKSGAILKQSNPQKMMNDYQCETLEAVYFFLWAQNDSQLRALKHKFSEGNTSNNESELNSKSFESNKSVDFTRILTLVWAFSLRLRKLRLLFLSYIAIPFLAVFSLYLAVGHLPHDIPVAVYSEERHPSLSQQMIDSMDHNFLDVIQYESRDSAIASIIEGKNTFAILFDQNFTKRLESRLSNPFIMNSEQHNTSLIRLYTDSSRAVSLTFALQYLAEVSLKFMTNVSLSLGLNSNAFTLPVHIEQPIYGSHPITGEHAEKFRVNYHYLIPSILMVTFHMSSMVLSALSFVIFRNDQQLDRYLMAGGQPIEFMAAHYLSKIMDLSLQTFFLLACSSFLFDIKQDGSYIDVYLICFLQSLQGVSIGFLIAILFKHVISVGVSLISCFIYLIIN